MLRSAVRAYARPINAAALSPCRRHLSQRPLLSATLAAVSRSVRQRMIAPKAAPRTALRFPSPVWSQAAVRPFSTGDLPPHFEIPMPALSPTMTQGNLASWQKEVGDEVAVGDVIAEIETDKAVMEFESNEDGYLAATFVEAGTQNVQVGTPLCIIAESAEDVARFKDYVPSAAGAAESTSSPNEPASAASSTDASASTPTASKPHTPSPAGGLGAAAEASGNAPRTFASPLARRLAAERNVPLNNVVGSGPGGRVVKADIESAATGGVQTTAAAPTAPAPAALPPQPAVPAAGTAGEGFVDTPLSEIRRVIAERLTASKQTVPHYYLSVDVNMEAVSTLRERLNTAAQGEYKISVNDFIVKAAARALVKVPACNSAWGGSFIRQYASADVCVAVDTGAGLITPIVFGAERKGLSEIATDTKELAARAKAGKLQPHEFQGGTFTISNLGMFGVKNFSAIINPPQACILAVGASEMRLVPDTEGEGGVRRARMMSVTLSCDHRVVDGAVGAQWLQHFKANLEDPINMLV